MIHCNRSGVDRVLCVWGSLIRQIHIRITRSQSFFMCLQRVLNFKFNYYCSFITHFLHILRFQSALHALSHSYHLRFAFLQSSFLIEVGSTLPVKAVATWITKKTTHKTILNHVDTNSNHLSSFILTQSIHISMLFYFYHNPTPHQQLSPSSTWFYHSFTIIPFHSIVWFCPLLLHIFQSIKKRFQKTGLYKSFSTFNKVP